MDADASSGQHPAARSLKLPVGRENVIQLTDLLQTQIYCFYEFFDRDEDVLCLAGASKATIQTIKLLRGTTGAFYFGSTGAFGLCRYQSLQMVATSCRLRNKIDFVDQCQADTSHCVEFIVTSVQRACFLAGAPRKYVLATIDKRNIQRGQYCVIPSLRLKIYMLIAFNGCGVMIRFEDMYGLYSHKTTELREYRGLAFPVACSSEPLIIPSTVRMQAHHWNAIHHCPTFLIAIWKNDGRAVTAVDLFPD